MSRWAGAIFCFAVALALTIHCDRANQGVDVWMGAAVVAWMFASYEFNRALHG